MISTYAWVNILYVSNFDYKITEITSGNYKYILSQDDGIPLFSTYNMTTYINNYKHNRDKDIMIKCWIVSDSFKELFNDGKLHYTNKFAFRQGMVGPLDFYNKIH